MGSLSHIIWAMLAVLFLVYLLATFSDDFVPGSNRAYLKWGKVDLKSQIP
jgi:hypothetical protein